MFEKALKRCPMLANVVKFRQLNLSIIGTEQIGDGCR